MSESTEERVKQLEEAVAKLANIVATFLSRISIQEDTRVLYKVEELEEMKRRGVITDEQCQRAKAQLKEQEQCENSPNY